MKYQHKKISYFKLDVQPNDNGFIFFVFGFIFFCFCLILEADQILPTWTRHDLSNNLIQARPTL